MKISKILKYINPNIKVQITSTTNNGELEVVNAEIVPKYVSVSKMKQIDMDYEFERINPIDDKTIEIHCKEKKVF